MGVLTDRISQAASSLEYAFKNFTNGRQYFYHVIDFQFWFTWIEKKTFLKQSTRATF
jgi:hypothetical protein